MTEGRQAFLRRVSGIERGAECARYEPLLSALADGEASPEQLAVLRPHMRTCLSCRARLREFRAMPDRVARVLPPAALAADGGGPLRSVFESVVGAAQHKAAAMGDRLQTTVELATGQKVAALAASAAARAGAVAGGGTAIDEFANHQGPPLPPPVQQEEAQPVKDEVPAEPTPPPAAEAPPTEPAPDPAVPATPDPAPPPPADPAIEFTPTSSAQAAAPAAAPAPPQPTGEVTPPGAAGSTRAGSGAGEFAP